MLKENNKLPGYGIIHPLNFDEVYYLESSSDLIKYIENNDGYFTDTCEYTEDLKEIADCGFCGFVETEDIAKIKLNELCDHLIERLNKVKELIK